MFGHNEIVGQKFFKDSPKDSLLVTSRFYTVQGEGPYAGMPAYFIRLAKCNLACSFCDTYFDTGEWKTYDELLEESSQVIIQWYKDNFFALPTKRQDVVLVMTGGEPSLQNNLAAFLVKARKFFRYTQIESNGTITQAYPYDTTVVVSPKCLEKNGKPVRYLEPKPEMLERADCLKFVMSADPDSPYCSIPEWATEWKDKTGRDVYVSPMNVYNREPAQAKTMYDLRKNVASIEERSSKGEQISFWEAGLLNMKQNQANHEYTARYAAAYGMRFQMQLHLFASMA